MITKDFIADDLRNIYMLWKSERDMWAIKARESEAVYYNDKEGTGTTFTAEQINKIKEYTNIPVNINFVYPAVNQKLAIMTAEQTSFQIVSTDGRANEIAFLLDKMKYHTLYRSKAKIQKSEANKDMLITGMGHMDLEEESRFAPGSFGISPIYRHYSEVILDPNQRSRTGDDSEGYIIDKEITLTVARQLFGYIERYIIENIDPEWSLESIARGADELGGVSESRQIKSNSTYNQKLQVRQFYTKKFTTCYMVKNEQGDVLKLFRENFNNETEATVLNDYVDKYDDVFVVRKTVLNDVDVETVTLPYTNYTLHSYFFEWGGKPYRSYGMIHFVKGMQEAFDKAIQLFLLNGIKSNNANWFAPVSTIPKPYNEAWEKHGNNPNYVKYYVPQVIDGQLLKPEQERVQGLNSFYPQILDILKGGIDNSTGINPFLGGGENAPNIETFSTVKTFQDNAMQRVALALEYMAAIDESYGNVVIEALINNIKPNQNYTFFDQQGKMNELMIADDIQMLKQSKFVLMAVPGEPSKSQMLAGAQALFDIAQSTPSEYKRDVYVEEAMRMTGNRTFAEVTEKVDTVERLQQEIQQYQEQIKEDEEILKQMRNRVLNAELKADIAEAKASAEIRIERQATKAEGDMRLEVEKSKNKNGENK